MGSLERSELGCVGKAHIQDLEAACSSPENLASVLVCQSKKNSLLPNPAEVSLLKSVSDLMVTLVHQGPASSPQTGMKLGMKPRGWHQDCVQKTARILGKKFSLEPGFSNSSVFLPRLFWL